MRGVHYRTWAPPESRVQIEYSTEVLRELRLGSATSDACGLLFGTRRGRDLRVVAARRLTDNIADIKDPRLAGLAPVGIFAARIRGEVFLTEADLQRFEEAKISSGVALVVAGTRGGFFVPEPDGSFQTIRSYEEFGLADIPLRGEDAPQVTENPASGSLHASAPITLSRSRCVFMPSYAWLGLGCWMLLSIPAAAHFRWGWLESRPPLGLSVRAEAGQLRIAWNPALARKRGRLEIVDGTQYTTLPLSKTLANATYAPRTGDVEVRLVLEDGRSTPRSEVERVVTPEPKPSPEIERTRAQIATLEAEAAALRTVSETNLTYSETLETALRVLTRAR